MKCTDFTDKTPNQRKLRRGFRICVSRPAKKDDWAAPSLSSK